MIMGFRIRNTHCESENAWKARDRLYREHLEKFNKRSNRSLWKYFYWDFFHDGMIQKINFWENPGNCVFYLTCPNIKRKKGDDFEYINIDFKCTFRDVVYFHLDHDNPKEMLSNQLSPFIFLYPEIL